VTSLSDSHCAANAAGLDSIDVTVNAVDASFTSSGSLIHLGSSATFTSTGTGSSYSWTFGDGGTANTANASHTYAALGIYTVSLTVTNAQGCSATTTMQDTVTYPLGIADVPADQALKIYSYQNKVMVDFSQFKTVDAKIVIYDILGQVMSNETHHVADTYVRSIESVQAAYVIVSVTMSDGQVVSKKLFIIQ
jgi:PKD repeat protein